MSYNSHAVVPTLRQRLAPSLSVPTLSNPLSTAFDSSSRLVTRRLTCFFGIFLKHMCINWMYNLRLAVVWPSNTIKATSVFLFLKFYNRLQVSESIEFFFMFYVRPKVAIKRGKLISLFPCRKPTVVLFFSYWVLMTFCWLIYNDFWNILLKSWD